MDYKIISDILSFLFVVFGGSIVAIEFFIRDKEFGAIRDFTTHIWVTIDDISLQAANSVLKSKVGLRALLSCAFILMLLCNYHVLKADFEEPYGAYLTLDTGLYVGIIAMCIPSIIVLLICKRYATAAVKMLASKNSVLDMFFEASKLMVVIFLVLFFVDALPVGSWGAFMTFMLFFSFSSSLYFFIWLILAAVAFLYGLCAVLLFIANRIVLRISESAKGPTYAVAAVVSMLGLILRFAGLEKLFAH